MGLKQGKDGDAVVPQVVTGRIKSESKEMLCPNQSLKRQKDCFVCKTVEKCEFQSHTPSAPVLLAKTVTPSVILWEGKLA